MAAVVTEPFAEPSTAPGPRRPPEQVLFERLRRQHLDGELDGGLVSPAELTIATPDSATAIDDCAGFVAEGIELVRSGAVAPVILAGGMATRFGGLAKATVEVVPGWSLLRIKLAQVEALARSLEVRLPVCVLVSRASRDTVEQLLSGIVDDELLSVVTPCQTMLPRMRPDGEVVRDPAAADGVSSAPPGHGEVIAVLREQVLGLPHLAGIECFVLGNIDNVVAEPSLAAVGAHRAWGVNLVEAVASAPSDRGGLIVSSGDHAGGVVIVEDFRLDGANVDVPKLLSTNTIYLAASSVRDAAPLPWYPVAKTVDGRPVVQFEQLLCDIGRTHPLRAIRVERDGPGSRYIPLKTADALDTERARIVETLRLRGLDLTGS